MAIKPRGKPVGGHLPAPASRRADAPWMASATLYLAGSSLVDEMDMAAMRMERKWGVDRLRLLVSAELREKFDRQRYLTNQAIFGGELEDVRVHTARMAKAWAALDREAEALGRATLNALRDEVVPIMEAPLSDGRVLVIVSDEDALNKARELIDSRACVVWSIGEVARMVESEAWMSAVKAAFPGAEVTKVKTKTVDPLDRLTDTRVKLDDPILF